MTHRIHTLELGPMENFVYLIEDTASKTAAVVDPAWEAAEIIACAEAHELTITDILLTHSHNDHINAVEAMLEQYDAKLHLTHAEAAHWGAQLVKPELHHGGDVLAIGSSEIEILHTPGHTPGSACYRVGDDLITGDTMFVFGCGRCDMAGGDPNAMFDTLRRIKGELPQHTCIRPGHNYAVQTTSTLAEETAGNPFMHFDDRADFVKFRLELHGKVRQSPYAAVSAAQTAKYLNASDSNT